MIGEKVTLKNKIRYADLAAWCNNNNAILSNQGEYYEVVPAGEAKEE